MKSLLLSAAAALALAVGYAAANETTMATKSSAAPSAIQLTANDSKTDGGTRPNARMIVTIEAPEGMFIWAPSINVSHAGSRGLKSHKMNTTPSDAVHSDFSTLAAQSVTYVVASKGYNPFGTSSVTATAHLAALAYPIEAFEELIMQRLPDA